MLITSWNCRGLENSTKVVAIKDLLRMAPSKILLLQEMKIEEEALLLINNNHWKLKAGKVISARGTCGGLAILWSDEKFQLKNVYATQRWIFTELFHHSSKTSYALFNLYVPVNYTEKHDCWKMLSDFLELSSPVNIVLAGDLNITLAPNEKKGGLHGKDHL